MAAAAVALPALVGLFVLGSDDDPDERPPPPRAAEHRATPPAPQRDRPIRPRRRLTEAQAIQRVRRRMPYVTRGGRRGRMIALTFDDGPGPLTPAFLAELRRLRAPATFFQLGGQVQSNPALALAEHGRPFAVGSHTISHARLTTLDAAAQQAEIAGGADAIEANSGRRPRLFRPPYGAWDAATLAAARRDRALVVFWTHSIYDWKLLDADRITRRALRLAEPGAILLLHDAGGSTRQPTLEALPRVVRGLRRRGYRLVTVPRLLRDAPPERRPPRPPSPYPG